MGTFRVQGYCFVPMSAETTVEADTPEAAIAAAMGKWQKNKSDLIDPGSADVGAAFDWQPTAELIAKNG